MKYFVLPILFLAVACLAEEIAPQKSKIPITGGYGVVFGTDVSRDIQAKKMPFLQRSDDGRGTSDFKTDRPITYSADFKSIPVGSYSIHITPKNRVYQITASISLGGALSDIKEPEKFRQSLIDGLGKKYGEPKFRKGEDGARIAEYADPKFENRRMRITDRKHLIEIDYYDTKLEKADRTQPSAGGF